MNKNTKFIFIVIFVFVAFCAPLFSFAYDFSVKNLNKNHESFRRIKGILSDLNSLDKDILRIINEINKLI